MPTNITDSPTFTTPIVAPVDGDAANGASIQTVAQGLANRTAYLNVAVVTQAALIAGQSAILSPSVARGAYLNLDIGNSDASGTGGLPGWLKQGGPTIIGLNRRWRTNGVNTAWLYFPILLANGSVITAISAQFTPGAGGNMGVFLCKNAGGNMGTNTPPTSTQIGVVSTTGTGQQVVTLSGLTETVDSLTKEYFIAVAAGSSASSVSQVLHAIGIDYTDHGPRNY